jgi:hypothetical protein
MGNGSNAEYKMIKEITKLKKTTIAFAVSILVVPIIFSLIMITTIAAAPVILLDVAKTWITGWFDNPDEAIHRMEQWHSTIYPNFKNYGNYSGIGYAEAVSCYYFLENGKDINDSIPMGEYMNYFTGTIDMKSIYKEFSEMTGYEFNDVSTSRIDKLKTQIMSKRVNGLALESGGLVAAPIEAAIEWGTAIANDDSHGYSQITRNGNPNYDCSSFICYAMQNVGFNIPITSTHSMKRLFLAEGNWEWIPSYMLGDLTVYGVTSGQSGLKRGDILLNEQTHTEIYLGGGMSLGAHWDWDGRNGDSSGLEINIAQYWDSNWDGVLRYIGS